MPNKPRADNPHRAVRVEDELWRAAQEKATEEGTTVSAVIRDALTTFVDTADARAALSEHRREWADFIERWEQSVGPEPPTVRSIVSLLRADRLPWGAATKPKTARPH